MSRRKNKDKMAQLANQTHKVVSRASIKQHQQSNPGANMTSAKVSPFVKTSDGKFYKIIHADEWQALDPLEVTEYKGVCHRWKGKKISIEGPGNIWDQVLSFLKWSYDETKSETIVHLFYHAERGWMPLVLPQKGHTGLAVDLFEEHPNKAPTMARLGGTNGDFYMVSTVHHHGGICASQSSHDHADEKTKEGIHLTMGDMGKTQFSIHARCSFRKEILPAKLVDWFEMPAYIKDNTPPEDHERLLAYRLGVCPAVIEFPEWWKDNVIKVPPPAAPVYTPGHGWQQPGPYGDHGGAYPGRGVPDHYARTVSPHMRYKTNYEKEKFAEEVMEIMRGYSYDLATMLNVLQEIDVEPYRSLVEAMVENGFDFKETIEVFDGMQESRRVKLEEEEKSPQQEAAELKKAEEDAFYLGPEGY